MEVQNFDVFKFGSAGYDCQTAKFNLPPIFLTIRYTYIIEQLCIKGKKHMN